PEFTYSRFGRLTDLKEDEETMYEFGLRHEFSILRQMILSVMNGEVSDEDLKDNENKEYLLSCLQSDAIIRNGEVLMAVLENAVSERDRHDVSTRVEKWTNLYTKGIGESGLNTHKTSPQEMPYSINFKFLQALTAFLNEDLTEKSDEESSEEYKTGLNEFRNIFESAFLKSEEMPSRQKVEPVGQGKNQGKKGDNKGGKKSSSINPYLKGEITRRLKDLLGESPKTASEIQQILRKKFGYLTDLPDKDLNKFVTKRKSDAPFTPVELAEFILRTDERQGLWAGIIGLAAGE
ncbi:MAG: hypothetical protein K2J15_05090, partial [Muribaculaceae bacterium]|nr:hypothetical protein [Muribaculaceae bacterium]